MRVLTFALLLLCAGPVSAGHTVTEISNSESVQAKSVILDASDDPVDYNNNPVNPDIDLGSDGSYGTFSWEAATSEIDEDGDWSKCYTNAKTGYQLHTDIEKWQLSAQLVENRWLDVTTTGYKAEAQLFNWCSRELEFSPGQSGTYGVQFKFTESGLDQWGSHKNGVFLKATFNEHWCQWTFHENLGVAGKWVQTGSNPTWDDEYDGWEAFTTNSVYVNEYFDATNPAEAKVEINDYDNYFEAQNTGSLAVITNDLSVSIYVDEEP